MKPTLYESLIMGTWSSIHLKNHGTVFNPEHSHSLTPIYWSVHTHGCPYLDRDKENTNKQEGALYIYCAVHTRGCPYLDSSTTWLLRHMLTETHRPSIRPNEPQLTLHNNKRSSTPTEKRSLCRFVMVFKASVTATDEWPEIVLTRRMCAVAEGMHCTLVVVCNRKLA